VQSLIARVEEIRTTRNSSLRFLGLLVNKWNKRNAGQNAVVEAFQKNLAEYLIPHALPESTAISAITHTRQPVWRNARSGSQRRAGKIVRSAMDWLLDEAIPSTTVHAAAAR
jgi:chromosome partitioning protein